MSDAKADGTDSAPAAAAAPSASRRTKPKPKPAPTSGVVPTLRNAASGMHIIERRDRSFYLFDVLALLSMAFSFDGFVRRRSRRGGWRHPGYYAGMIVRAALIKLQRVGIATEQVAPPQPEMIHAKNFDLPGVVLYFIDQYGEKIDVAGVRIAPLVTDRLCSFLGTISRNLEDNNAADHLTCLNLANFRGWIYGAYGIRIYLACCWSGVAARLNLPFTASLVEIELDESIADLVARQRIDQGAAALTGAQYFALTNTLPGPPVAPPLPRTFFDIVAPAALAVGGAFTANFVAAVNAQRLQFVAVANPIPGGYLPTLAPVRCFLDEDQAQDEMQELAARMTAREVPTAVSGSFAPLVLVSNASDDASGSCVVRSLTPAEYVIGIAINQTVIMTTRTGLPFNVDTLEGRRARYTTSEIGCTVRELRARIWREGLIR